MDMILVSVLFLVTVIYSVTIILKQQRTIDRLTDKLMSKDYSEYKRNNHITIDDSKPQRKPISFYDDPSIEIDEDSVN